MILITNDDGYENINVHILYDILKEFDDVKMIVPDRNMSSCGNSISFNKKFKVYIDTDGKISIDGTPVDCIRLGIEMFEPDLIITGINDGYNVGLDSLLCSGTFMSAREGANNDIKSLACSVDKFSKIDKDLTLKIIKKALSEDFTLANLNIISEDYKITNLCDTTYEYRIIDNSIQISLLMDYPKGTDGEAIYNLDKSSLTIMR